MSARLFKMVLSLLFAPGVGLPLVFSLMFAPHMVFLVMQVVMVSVFWTGGFSLTLMVAAGERPAARIFNNRLALLAGLPCIVVQAFLSIRWHNELSQLL